MDHRWVCQFGVINTTECTCLRNTLFNTLGIKQNGVIVLTLHLSLCCSNHDSRPHTWRVDEKLEMQIGLFLGSMT